MGILHFIMAISGYLISDSGDHMFTVILRMDRIHFILDIQDNIIDLSIKKDQAD